MIMALDIGTRMGVAIGRPGIVPASFAVRLKQRGEPAAVALANAVAFLAKAIGEHRPSIIVKEAPPALEGFAKMGNAAQTVRQTYGLHAIAEAMAVRFAVPWHDVHNATARKHFLGKGRLGSREETKRAVVARCHLLRYFGRDCLDEDRADACCVFDWAAAHLCGAPSAELHLFGERAA